MMNSVSKKNSKSILIILISGLIISTLVFISFINFNFQDFESFKIFIQDSYPSIYFFIIRCITEISSGELTSYYFYIFILGILVIQIIVPAKLTPQIFSISFLIDFIWFLLYAFLFSLFLGIYSDTLTNYFENHLNFLKIEMVSHWPVALQIAAVILVGDFLGWFNHYVRHKIPWFWHFHVVHHSQRELNMFTDYRVHIVEDLISYSIRFIPFLSLVNEAFLPTSLGWILFNRWHTRIYHSNLKLIMVF